MGGWTDSDNRANLSSASTGNGTKLSNVQIILGGEQENYGLFPHFGTFFVWIALKALKPSKTNYFLN